MTKKDWTYIAAVEKAIAEKYGKDTTQDFRSDWAPHKEDEYLSQLKDARQKKDSLRQKKQIYKIGDIEIIKPKRTESDSRTCPVCKTYSFSGRDDLYMNRFQICHSCYHEFYLYNEEKWDAGWRPSTEQIKAAILRRTK